MPLPFREDLPRAWLLESPFTPAWSSFCLIMNYTLFVPTLALSLLSLAACKKKEGGDFQRAPLPLGNIEGKVVQPSVLQSEITAAGTLLPAEQTDLRAETSGRVISINLPEGKRVPAGTLLVKLNDEDLQTQLRKLEAQLQIAQTTAQRLKGLLEVKGTSQQEYDLATLQITNIQAEMDLVKVRIRQTEIRAPYEGVIGLRQISPGAYLTPTSPIATIRDDRNLRLDFTVPEKYANLVKPGQSISFSVDGSQRRYSAIISASEQSVDASTRDLLFRALVKEKSPELTAGRFANVDLSLNTKPTAIMVPTEAIIPQAKDKKVVIAKGGKATFITVKTGVRQAGEVEILEGLQAGDTLVTTGLLFLRPNAPFQFSKIQ